VPDPPRYQPFDEVRLKLEDDLVGEKVQAEVDRLFGPIREAMQAYSDAYAQYLDAQEQGNTPTRPTPRT
jgi:hypothetical protein